RAVTPVGSALVRDCQLLGLAQCRTQGHSKRQRGQHESNSSDRGLAEPTTVSFATPRSASCFTIVHLYPPLRQSKIDERMGKPTVPFQRASADPAPPGTADFVKRIDPGIATRAITGGDPNLPKLMHHKYVIRDGRSPDAALWTGSPNFTNESWTLQENNIVRVDSPELCAYYETDFEELWTRGDIGTSGEHDTGRVQLPGPGSPTIEVAFAPGEGRAID